MALPKPSITVKSWRAAVIKATFQKFRVAVVKAAQAKVKKLKTSARRIVSVRTLAKQMAKSYNNARTEPITAKVINLPTGAKVQVTKNL